MGVHTALSVNNVGDKLYHRETELFLILRILYLVYIFISELP